MDLTACAAADSTTVSQHSWNNNPCQRWNIEQTGADTFRLISKGDKTAQLQAISSAWRGDASQQWVLKPLS